MDNKFTLILDSTQIISYLTCPTYWMLSDKQQLRRFDTDEKRTTVMGSLGHKYLELFYKARARGFNENQSLDYANESVNDMVEDEFLLSEDDKAIVTQSIRDYVYCYAMMDRDFIVTNPETVEVGFSEIIYEDEYVRYILEGKIDIFEAIYQGQKVTVDHKFQTVKRDLYKKSVQFRNYAMVGKSRLLIINYLRLTKKRDGTTFQRDVSAFDPIVEHPSWKNELIDIFNRVRTNLLYITTGKDNEMWDPFFKNRASCQGKWGTCMFTDLCDEPYPEVRKEKQSSLYHIKEAWKPWN